MLWMECHRWWECLFECNKWDGVGGTHHEFISPLALSSPHARLCTPPHLPSYSLRPMGGLGMHPACLLYCGMSRGQGGMTCKTDRLFSALHLFLPLPQSSVLQPLAAEPQSIFLSLFSNNSILLKLAVVHHM